MDNKEQIKTLKEQLDISHELHHEEFTKVRQYEELIKKIKFAIYTQHCTMNHMENTEYEKGKISGLINASKIIDRYLNEYNITPNSINNNYSNSNDTILKVKRYEKVLSALLNIVADQEQDELVDIITDALLGHELNERYENDALEGTNVLSQFIFD